MLKERASQVVLVVKNPPANAGLIHGSRRSSGEGHGNPLRYSCFENLMGGGAWWAMVHSVTKNWTQLNRLSTYTCVLKSRRKKKKRLRCSGQAEPLPSCCHPCSLMVKSLITKLTTPFTKEGSCLKAFSPLENEIDWLPPPFACTPTLCFSG